MLQFVEGCDDPKLLRQLIANARRLKADDLVAAAFRKLVSIVPDEKPGTIEYDFWCTIQAFEQLLSEERGKTIRLSRTRQKLARVGVVNILSDFATSRPTDGFLMLAERDMLDLAGETLVAKYPDRFAPETVAAAASRLSEFRRRTDASAGDSTAAVPLT